MKHFADLLTHFGPLGVFLLAVIESSGVPIPTALDVLLVWIGWKAPERAVLSATLAVIGSLIGNLGLFGAAHFGGRRWARAEPTGRTLRFHVWFRRYGLVTVFVPALVPIPLPLKVFVISAGALRTGLLRFGTVVLIARVARYFGLAYLGVRLGQDAQGFLARNVWILAAGAGALVLLLAVGIHLAERRRANIDVTMEPSNL